MDNHAFGRNVTEQLDRLGESQHWLAERIHVSDVTLGRWISGQRQPKAYAVLRISRVLGVSMAELMRGVDDGFDQEERPGDLVSRQYLLQEYDRQRKGPPGGARKIIEEAPAAHPAGKKLEDVCEELKRLLTQPNVITCKDCKHRDPESRRCRHGAQWCPIPKEDKDYCSFAERRDERV